MRSPDPKNCQNSPKKQDEDDEDDDLMENTEECPSEKINFANKPLDGSVGTMASNNCLYRF
jgi:hypothetical protein